MNHLHVCMYGWIIPTRLDIVVTKRSKKLTTIAFIRGVNTDTHLSDVEADVS